MSSRAQEKNPTQEAIETNLHLLYYEVGILYVFASPEALALPCSPRAGNAVGFAESAVAC